MKIQKIEPSNIDKVDIAKYHHLISTFRETLITASDVKFDKRIITIRKKSDDIDNQITLVNPVIVETNKYLTAFMELDTYKKNKVRKTKRFTGITVDTDNLGKVLFSADNEKWESAKELYGDEGLMECIHIQRLIDAIDGIDVTDPQRKYSETITVEPKLNRNTKIMVEGPDGRTFLVKQKQSESYLNAGCKLV